MPGTGREMCTRTKKKKPTEIRKDKQYKTQRVHTHFNLKLPGSGVQLIWLFHALPVRENSHSSSDQLASQSDW